MYPGGATDVHIKRLIVLANPCAPTAVSLVWGAGVPLTVPDYYIIGSGPKVINLPTSVTLDPSTCGSVAGLEFGWSNAGSTCDST